MACWIAYNKKKQAGQPYNRQVNQISNEQNMATLIYSQ